MSGIDRDAGELAAELRRALARADALPAGDVESISVLIMAGEWRVALEALCTQIFEYDVEIDDELRADLVRLGMELDVAVAHLLGDPWAQPPSKSDGGGSSNE
jgi:hypothetical protein